MSITALSYSQECYDSLSGWMHGESYTVKEVFIPEYNLCYNIQKGEKPKLNIFECSRPRVVDDAVQKYRNKTIFEEMQKPIKHEKSNHTQIKAIPVDLDAPITPNLSHPSADFPHLADEILVPQFTQQLTQEGALKTIELPLERVKKLQQILITQKQAEMLLEEWLKQYN